jgi:hypothetical protein
MLKGLGCFKFSTSGFCIVELCHGNDSGRDFYVFIAIEPQNYRYFKSRYRPGEHFNFNAFGYELVRGWGKEPPEAIKEYMLVKHGVEFGISDNFLNRMIANVEPTPMPLGREFFDNMSATALQNV